MTLWVRYSSLIKWGMFWPLFGMFFPYMVAQLRGLVPAMLQTHCHQPEFFPSVSALTAAYPNRQIWQFSMAMMLVQRFSDAVIVYFHFKKQIDTVRVSSYLNEINMLTAFLHVLEYFGLATLSFITSDDHLLLHQSGFVGWLIFSWIRTPLLLYMQARLLKGHSPKSTSSVLGKALLFDPAPAFTEEWQSTSFTTLRHRIRWFVANVFCFSMAIYFFYSHTVHCVHYHYSFFAICEWLTVITNVWCHSQAAVDMGSFRLALVSIEKTDSVDEEM